MIAQMRMSCFCGSCPLWRSQTSDPSRLDFTGRVSYLIYRGMRSPSVNKCRRASATHLRTIIVFTNDDQFDIYTIIPVDFPVGHNIKTDSTMPDVSTQKRCTQLVLCSINLVKRYAYMLIRLFKLFF